MVLDAVTSALQHWIELLGRDAVDYSEVARSGAETATFKTEAKIVAILRPANKQQLQDCLCIATRFGTPLYPISSGKNWGYGSRVPPRSGCALVDLSRLNQILDFSEDLGYVTVEPGVTQRQLYEFLQERQSRLWMDATGSSPDCSLIGNVMERGFGHTPLGDHFAHVCALEVLLPTGEFIETGSAAFPQSRTSSVSRWGVGPSLDGLFSQSNLGIVTRMTIWLMPAPDVFEAFFFRCNDASGLAPLINACRELRLKEVLRSAVHIGNDYKVLAGLQQYPWAETGEQTPLSAEMMAQFRKKLSFGVWNASGGLYGTAAQVAEAKKALEKVLPRQGGSLKFLKPSTLAFAKRWAKAFKMISGWDLSRTVELVEPVLGLMQGVPTRQALGSAYWRKRFPVPQDPDPDRDRCGLLWYAPVSPADGEQIKQLTNLASEVMLRHGFEPQISLTMLTPRMVCCVVSITYDREVSGEDDKAKACYDKVSASCMDAGFYPYRSGIQSNVQSRQSDGYSALLRRLKTALDPNGILAPGRYEATSDQPSEVRESELENLVSVSKRLQ